MSSGKQYYTVAEVNDRLGELRGLFDRVMQLRAQLKMLYRSLDAKGYAPTRADLEDEDDSDLEDDVDIVLEDNDELSAAVIRDRAVFRGLVATLREQVAEVRRMGGIVKDIENGLVDWPALHQGREVLLCWKYGESEIAHWHELTSGFAGRRPLSELDPDEPT